MLELCVDNLQFDFFYDYIQLVCVEFMQVLWCILCNFVDSIFYVVYCVFGKFGGSNRKMLKELQKLYYVVIEVQGFSIIVEFFDCKVFFQFFMEKVIEIVLDCLKSVNIEFYYWRQVWEVIKCFLVVMMSLEDNKYVFYQFLVYFNFIEKIIFNVIILYCYKVQDILVWKMFEQVLIGVFMFVVIKDLWFSVLFFVVSLICYYMMVVVV